MCTDPRVFTTITSLYHIPEIWFISIGHELGNDIYFFESVVLQSICSWSGGQIFIIIQ